MGGLDGVVTNAAMLADDDAMPADTPLKSWQDTLAVNLTGAFLVYKHARHIWLSSKAVALSPCRSVAHSASAVPQIAYTASKGGLRR